MVAQISVTMTTDLVEPRNLNRIRNGVNRFAGEEQIVKKFLPNRFTLGIYNELPGTARPRSRNYTRRKLRQVGHAIPNVLTGRLRRDMPATARVTATTNGGKVHLRAYWAGTAKTTPDGRVIRQGMRESQRQEFETLGPRERQRLAKAMEREFLKQINDPANRRKRRRKGGAGHAA
jgi:hypothetical protein